jgi:homoserine kinase
MGDTLGRTAGNTTEHMSGPGWAEVTVPASSGNLGAGFDALGLAVELRDIYHFEPSPHDHIEADGKFAEFVPRDVRKNLAFRAFRLLAPAGAGPYRLHAHRVIPAQGGLGSSGSAIVGGLLAAKLAFNLDIQDDELLHRATELEGHPDNVAPALLGGLVITVHDGQKLHSLRIEFPPTIGIVLIVPGYRVPTRRARQVLPDQVTLGDAVANLSRAALLIGALENGRFDQLEVATADRLHLPYRTKLNPAFEPCAAAAMDAGAYAATLSGSGPTVLALCPCQRNMTVASAMADACIDAGFTCETYVLGAATAGAQPTDKWREHR